MVEDASADSLDDAQTRLRWGTDASRHGLDSGWGPAFVMPVSDPNPVLPTQRWGVRAATLGAAVAAGLISSPTSEPDEAPAPTTRPASKVDKPARWMTKLLDQHARSLPPAASRPALLRGMEERVGVPIRLAELERRGAEWVGAEVVSWDSANTAMLRYRLRQHRVTVFVYDSERTPLRTLAVLRPKVVSGAVVFVGEKRGYSVAVIERLGLGHALVTDLDPDECAELLAAIPGG